MNFILFDNPQDKGRLSFIYKIIHAEMKEVYSPKENNLSSRAQHHFRHHESVSVMQLYAAIRILLLNTSSVWERILQMCRILDILEQCFCDCYSGVTLHPFEGGMEKIVREKMLSVAGYDFGAVISDVGEWKRRE